MIRKAFPCVILGILCLLLFSGSALWMNVKSLSETFGYNTALFLGKMWLPSWALHLLPASFSGYDDRIQELRGDLLFSLDANTGSILEAYYAARDIAHNARLEAKIALLEEANSRPDESMTSPPPDTELESVRSQILKDQENRSEFLSPYRAQGERLEQDIWHLRQRLSEDTLTEYKDW